MSCRIIISPVTNKEETSILWNEIRSASISDNQADEIYNQTTSEPFIERFGNWIEEPESIDKSKVNSIGEPKIEYLELPESNKSQVEGFQNKLKDVLLTFIKGLGIEVNTSADDILEEIDLNMFNLEKDVLAAFDVLQKYLAFKEGHLDLLPNQAASIIYTFLGKKSKLSKDLWINIKEWSEYEKYYTEFNKSKQSEITIEDEDSPASDKFNSFAHKQVIIKFIEKGLTGAFGEKVNVDKIENIDIDAGYFEKMGRKNPYKGTSLEKIWAKIFNFFKDTFGKKVFEKYNEDKLKSLVLDIVDDVYKEDYSKFLRSIVEKDGKLYDSKGNELEVKDYNETLKNEPAAKKIIERLVNNPFIEFKLSGSQTLRKYGKLYRAVDEDLHDIDGVITLSTFRKDPYSKEFFRWIIDKGLPLTNLKKHKQFIKEIIPHLEKLNWYINLKQEFPEFKFTNAFIGKDHHNGESITIQGEIPIGDKIYTMDFFLRTDEGNYPEIFDNYWKDWKQIFEAKLNMGRAKDLADLIYFEPFIKDKWKFTNKGFRYFSFAENNSTIIRGPINYYDEPGFKKRNPNFNPETYVNTVNKFGESKKEFPELTPTLNEVKPGVEEIFNNNPELAEIGSVMDYQEYLDSIFPFSKVKDIVYHTNTRGRIESFNSEKGLFVTPTWELAKTYKPGVNGKRFQLIINSKNIDEVSEETIMNGKKQSGDTLMYSEPDYTEYVVFEPEQIHILSSKADIQGFKEFVQGKQFDEGEVSYVLKSLSILQSTKAQELFEKGYKNNWSLDKILTELQIPKEQKQIILDSGKNSREEIITDLLANYSYTIEINTAKEGTNYFTEERTNHKTGETYYPILEEKTNKEITRFGNEEAAAKYLNKIYYNNTQYYSNLTVPGGTNYTENEIATPAITPSIKGHAQFATDNGIGWFRSDEQVINGQVYQQEEDDYGPAILQTYDGESTKTRRILEIQSDLFQKGRDNKRLVGEEDQIGADIDEAIEAIEERVKEGSFTREYADNEIKKLKSEQNSTQNQFLQLLNKNNNWVTFFIKSIIQDSAKKGYEKVLFPTGNTASKIEGHTTLEEFKKQKEDRIKELEDNLINKEIVKETDEGETYFSINTSDLTERQRLQVKGIYSSRDAIEKKLYEYNNPIQVEINQLKQELERVEREGFGALKPIYNFYENTVTNILKKQGFNPELITDEYGNTWNEVELNESHLDVIHFQKAQGVQSFDEQTAKEVASVLQEVYPEISLEYTELQGLRGQANIKAGKVLIDSLNQNTDTLAHEYAHHYISWFKNSPIVQKGIRLFGSEEALVQAIGEQAVAQKAKANIWYKQFWNWIKSLFNDKQAQLERLTDSFIEKKTLGEKQVRNVTHNQAVDPNSIQSDEKLIKTIDAAKLVFKNRQAELKQQYGEERAGTRESIKRIRAALEKLTEQATYSDILSVAKAQLDVARNALSKPFNEMSDADFVDVKKILYFTNEFDKLLLNAPEDESFNRQITQVRAETIRLQDKFDKFIKQRLVEASKAYGREITPEELEKAYADLGGAKSMTMSLETTNIPHLQFAAAVMNWRSRQTDLEVNQFDREYRDLVKKYSEEEFKKIFDAKGHLISMYSHDFYNAQAEVYRKLRKLNDSSTKEDWMNAKREIGEWFEQNYTYQLTPEGKALFEKHLKEVEEANTFDGEVNQDAVEKFKQQYSWENKGVVNPDGSFTITKDGIPRSNIGGTNIYADKWYAYLVKTPLEKYKNPDFEKVKDLEVYNWYVDKVQEIYDKTSPTLTSELGMYDNVIHQTKLDLTESKFQLGNILKGIKESALDWFTVSLTYHQLNETLPNLTDEKGRPKPLIRPKSLYEIQREGQFKNPVDLLRKGFEMAVTYEHKLEIQPLLELVGYQLEKTKKIEKNPITDKIRKDLNKNPLETAGMLTNAIEAFKFRENAELTGQTRTDDTSGIMREVTEEEKEQLRKDYEEWYEGGKIGPEPVLKKHSWIKYSDAVVDFTRLNLIGLKPFSALANVSIGMINNYVYAAREKDFNTKDLDWAMIKLRNSMLKFGTANLLTNKEAMKIGSLALKFGVVKETFIEDSKEYGKNEYLKKIPQVLFLLQESGEYLIANQILLAKLHNTKIKNLAGKEKNLYEAFDEFGDWKTSEFGEAPEWNKLVHLNESGQNISKLTQFRDRIDIVRHRTQGDYNTPMPFKGKFYGRIFMLFKTWLPRAIEERFGSENKYLETKGRMLTLRDGLTAKGLKGAGKFTLNTTLVTLAKLTNLPLIGEHIGKNPLAANAVESYEKYLKEIGLSDLDVENMRAQIAEFRMIILAVGLGMVFHALAGGGDDDPEVNFTVNLLQRVYQDLTFFIFPSSSFAIIKDPIPIMKTIMDGTEAINASINYITNPDKDTYKKGFRKGRSKTAKEWSDLFPVLSAWNSTEATYNQIFGENTYKYTKK